MLPDNTTTIGEEEFERMERVFQSMNAVERTRAKFRIWIMVWRGWFMRVGERKDSMVVVVSGKMRFSGALS